VEVWPPPPTLLNLRSGEDHAVEDDAEKRLADGRRASSSARPTPTSPTTVS